ncbi:hypothetical protein EMWEY_00059500 [Eimeria maxima]|uniref:Uncharacterized protein n=1 Tax=Eimeria maxima TaxID=5804 RepID=U6MA81_EIMMA|nr:hypothetical protein EMWEY_00059500 [Eimeria maxima]CDJ59963.1 hypothetical protein EMWEY_00059500 [Eimeria maxima]
MQPGVRSTLQGQEATIEKSAPPGHVKVPPRLPMALISPEASVESGHRTGVDASAHHMPGTSATLRMPDTAGSLDVAESGGVSDGPGATGASWRSAVAPVSVESSSSLVLQTSIPPLVSQSRPALATYSGASGFVGMSLPSSSVVASRPVDTTSNQHASGPLDTSTGAETPSLTTIVERSLIYQPIPVQGSGHHELGQREVGPASTENSGWTLAPVGESLVRQWRDRQPPQGSLAWVAAAPRTHVELGEAWPGDPTKHGLWGPNEHGIPLSQPALPRATRRPLFQGPPFAQLYASRESSGGVAVGPSIWSSEGSTSSEGAMRLWTGGPGTPLQLLPALGRGSLANSRWDVSLQRPSGLGRSGLPFKGVPVGEPKGALQETNATRAAGVAQTLFSPASAGFGQGLHSFRASGTDSDGR